MSTTNPVIYNGNRFRNSLEARWAIFFDEAEIEWEYEIDGFQLSNTNYRTCFKLPSYRYSGNILFVGIVPEKPTIDDLKRLFKISGESIDDFLLIYGIPGFPEFSTFGKDWKLEKGYVAIHFTGLNRVKDIIVNELSIDDWINNSSLRVFQTRSNGYSLMVWPIYFLLDEVTKDYKMLSEIDSVFSEDNEIFTINLLGMPIESGYFSSSTDGILVNHKRLTNGYEVAYNAILENDEYSKMDI
ncbi:MAG: hypothetical protein H6549_12810 [Chitinophagales bacterium]|nr:hypothetical protein [Chitinophagales bacterium]